ncbi:VOC family protein [Plantactinospora solaniradicis]|uniref:VOC family protein n=1 Tax=Plantactinospora solaniradicis TaxID=1723736 RepID=A0ABW1K4Z0_9ACTN
MTIAHFKDLCMDATDALRLARFWTDVRSGHLVDLGDGSARFDRAEGVPGTESIWIDPVPEPRLGKTRVHLDLRLPTPDPTPLVAAGATLVREPDDDTGWWVLADPDGNLFCAFPPSADGGTGVARPTVFELVVDSRDPVAQARWWAAVTGGRVDVSGSAASVVAASGFPWDRWVFDAVPEPKTVKNRMHWDVDLVDRNPAKLVEAGATVHREPDDVISWWIMKDPEGNEFCAFAPKER